MDWALFASMFWKISLAILLLALCALVGYVCATLGGIRNSLESIRNTLKTTAGVIDRELTTLLGDFDQTVREINSELPQILGNINRITVSVDEISRTEIQPTIRNIRQMTETVNRNLAKFDRIGNTAAEFSQETVRHARYFRDQLTMGITDIISAREGIKRGFEAFNRSRKTGKSAPESDL